MQIILCRHSHPNNTLSKQRFSHFFLRGRLSLCDFRPRTLSQMRHIILLNFTSVRSALCFFMLSLDTSGRLRSRKIMKSPDSRVLQVAGQVFSKLRHSVKGRIAALGCTLEFLLCVSSFFALRFFLHLF